MFTATKALAIALSFLLGESVGHAACALSTETQPKGEIGIQLLYPDRKESWQDAENLGVRWIRAELRWDWFEPTQNQYDPSYVDRVMALAAAHPEKRLLILFNHVPHWVLGEPDLLPARAAAAAAWLMQRHGKLIHAVEVFNEPNRPGEFGWPDLWSSPRDSARVYAKTLATVSSAIRDIDSKVFLISAGLSPTNYTEAYARWIVRLTPAPCFDSLGLHPYGEQGRFAKIKSNVKKLFEQEKRDPKPAWFSEYGTQDNAERRELITALAIEREAAPVTIFFTDKDLGLISETYGLRTQAGRAKPDYEVFKRLLQVENH